MAEGGIDLLARVTLDAWLLTQLEVKIPRPDGRTWERMIGELLRRPCLTLRQQGGLTTLFGVRAASGARHELDGASAGGPDVILVEAKSGQNGADKADAAIFHHKTFDFYCADPEHNATARWWRLLVSAAPAGWSLRASCVHLGIILCEPRRLPWPVLLRAAGQPSADLLLPDGLLAEAVRLGQTGAATVQERWRYNSVNRSIEFDPCHPSTEEIEDLLSIQDELSEYMLDAYDLYRPLMLPRRTMILRSKMSQIAT